ncbi:hexosaminidase D [Eurytemora carolleeae]|uniref:hexosaminidase D n=1 Tax=Eurytemora carolleeae TaxID=1294199 RepID=UPI000C7816EB|nr:hexosaminidase D [Eurytemora carolleeae]|eukprot:XP_023341300.1 hexosaminidase D-like [Eurytemora affinis]
MKMKAHLISRRKLAALLCTLTLFTLIVFLSGQFGLSADTDEPQYNARGIPNEDNYLKTKRRTKEVFDWNQLEIVPEESRNKGRFIPPKRVVHLDLKGAPPKISYLLQLLPMIKKAGGTDILIEYEDMFPHWGPLANLSALNAYSRKDVAELLSEADKQGLGVIPLVQTFGHLEFALKLEEFQTKLSGLPVGPMLCIFRFTSWANVVYIQVYQLGQCSRCIERLEKANAESTGSTYYDGRYLFLQHVRRLGEMVRGLNKVPIIWDDMLRNMDKSNLKESGIGELVEPMVWVYVEDIDRFVDNTVWRTYSAVFGGVWVASAYKGAFGERLYVVNMFRHLQNHLSWLDVMYRSNMSFDVHIYLVFLFMHCTHCTVLYCTAGWSRYDHFAVQCELLPVAVPSLVLSLAVVTSGKGDIHTIRKVQEILKCSPQKSLMLYDELRRNPNQWDLYRCSFPGVKAFSLISNYNTQRVEVEQLYTRLKEKDGWMSDWHVRHKFSSPWRVEETLKTTNYLPGNVRDLEKQAKRTLGLYFDEFTVKEWMEQHLLPLSEKLAEINNMADILTKPNHWPRRPI